MIVIHIITNDEPVITQIAAWLLQENLVHQAVDIDYQDSWKLTDKELVKTSTFKLSGRTKALLFSTIEDGLNTNFPDAQWCLYSTPLVNMDKVNQQSLISSTVRV